MILAEMWRKNMDAMNESERTSTMKGSLLRKCISTSLRKNHGEDDKSGVFRQEESMLVNSA